MVGVLNGQAKKAFVGGFVVAFLLCGLVGGLVTVKALALTMGYSSTTDALTLGDPYVVYNNYTMIVPDGYVAHVTELSGYADNDSALAHCRGGIYNSSGYLVSVTDEIDINGVGWYNGTLDCYLVSGDYFLAWGVGDGGIWYRHTGGNGNFTNGYEFVFRPVFDSETAYQVLCYVTYSLGEAPLVLDVNTNISGWGGLAVSMFLIGVSLVLALKSRSWAVNFLFGLVTVGFLGWTFANATVEVFGGWLLMMVLVGAVLVLVKGAVLVRASGV